jgi:hypothetical protein
MVESVISAVRALAALAVFVAACGAPVAAPSQPPATASAAPSMDPSPTPAATPSAASEHVPGIQVPDPTVTLDGRSFPIEATLVLERPAIDEQAREKVRQGILNYLMRLDWHRNGPGQGGLVTITGRFAEVVMQGLESTRTPGIERSFVLESFEVDRYLVKPWGTPGYAEARVTIVDRAKDGKAPDQRESGRLRLLGDRLAVVDGWDAASGRWFNDDMQPLTATAVRERILSPLPSYLRVESWVKGSAPESGFGSSMEDPFSKARSAYLKLLDRSKVSRQFSDVTARIERFETFAEIPDGLATVRLTGSVTMVDLDGREERVPFDRTVVVAATSSITSIVDEQTAPGVWMSGGDLMAVLKEQDRTFA